MTGRPATVAEPVRRECDVVVRHGYVITMNPERSIYSDVPKFGVDTAGMVAYLLSREQGDSAPLLAEEVFEMATLGSARAMG